jgi:4-hydroxybenzoate polyprenyltransferase
LLVLGRVSNLPTVWSNALAAWFLSGGGWDAGLLGAALAGSLAYYGGMAWNDVQDAEWDRARGKPRPIPEGRIGRRTAAGIAAATSAGGYGGLWALGADLRWIASLALAVAAYTLWHKRWSGAIWLMGACRGFLLLAVASVPAEPDRLVWMWAAALAVYVAGITLAARGEDGSGRVPWPARLWLAAPAVAGAEAWFRSEGAALGVAVAAWLGFVAWQTSALARLARGQDGAGPFVGRLLAGMVLIDAMAVAGTGAGWGPVVVCAAFLPVNRWAQRHVPAT